MAAFSRSLALFGVAVVAGHLQTAAARAADLTTEQARAIVAPFYALLGDAHGTDIGARLEAMVGPGYRSFGNNTEGAPVEVVAAGLGGLSKLVPDLHWDIKEVITTGDKVVVRGEATGTPAGPFFGAPATGKSFRIMSIDIWTLKDGKAVSIHHIEDWAGAIAQLTAK